MPACSYHQNFKILTADELGNPSIPRVRKKAVTSEREQLKRSFKDDSKDSQGFPGGAVVKNLTAHAGDAREAGWIPGWGRSPGGGMATHSSVLVRKVPWTEEPGGLQSMGSQRIKRN